jgi:hypothetical protein
MRTAAVARCPGGPSGLISEEMLSCHDWYATFAALAGASDKVPTDRPMDTVDASKFLTGESETTGREDLLFFGPDGELMSAKHQNLKVWIRYCEGFEKPILKPSFPLIYDLGSDPGERWGLFNDKMDIGWEIAVVLPAAAAYEKSIAEYPNIKPGAEFDGYPAPKAGE